jgi:hypothetical protein
MFRFQSQMARDASGAGIRGGLRLSLFRVQSRRFGSPSMTSGFPPKADTVTDGRHVSKVQEDIRPGASLHFRTDGNANCAGRRLAARGGIASKISGGEAIEAFPLSRKEGRARLLSRAMFSQPVRGSNSRRKAA